MAASSRQLYDLFILNIALQIFDGVATYQGLRVGWREANPILLAAFAHFGVGPALMLFKANACGLLFLLHRHSHHYLVAPALYLLASVHCVMSLIPWSAKFLLLLVHNL
ncbi:MAG: hypothetical protein HY270_22940 [Deltaproteobacteria bacterium]|nr:hypothetical protein [Deltaproteobacteria bacterium]